MHKYGGRPYRFIHQGTTIDPVSGHDTAHGHCPRLFLRAGGSPDRMISRGWWQCSAAYLVLPNVPPTGWFFLRISSFHASLFASQIEQPHSTREDAMQGTNIPKMCLKGPSCLLKGKRLSSRDAKLTSAGAGSQKYELSFRHAYASNG